MNSELTQDTMRLTVIKIFTQLTALIYSFMRVLICKVSLISNTIQQFCLVSAICYIVNQYISYYYYNYTEYDKIPS